MTDFATSVKAYLNGTALPITFSYPRSAPIKRNSIVPTISSNIYRESPYLVDSDIVIAWEIEGGCPAEYAPILALYNVVPSPTYLFVGYWGDSYNVKFLTLDPPVVKSLVHQMSGSFKVESVISFGN